MRIDFARFLDKRCRFADAYFLLDLIHKGNDPWTLSDESERFRYRRTQEILLREFRHLPRLLEIGCGQGRQTTSLLTLCDQYQGIDASPTAVKRASSNFFGRNFACRDFLSFASDQADKSYDLVTAFEVIYYAKDPKRFLSEMLRVGKSVAFSTYSARSEAVDCALNGLDRGLGWKTEDVSIGSAKWTVTWKL